MAPPDYHLVAQTLRLDHLFLLPHQLGWVAWASTPPYSVVQMNPILYVAAQYNYYKSWIEVESQSIQESWFNVRTNGSGFETPRWKSGSSSPIQQQQPYLFGHRSGFDEVDTHFI